MRKKNAPSVFCWRKRLERSTKLFNLLFRNLFLFFLFLFSDCTLEKTSRDSHYFASRNVPGPSLARHLRPVPSAATAGLGLRRPLQRENALTASLEAAIDARIAVIVDCGHTDLNLHQAISASSPARRFRPLSLANPADKGNHLRALARTPRSGRRRNARRPPSPRRVRRETHRRLLRARARPPRRGGAYLQSLRQRREEGRRGCQAQRRRARALRQQEVCPRRGRRR